MPDTVVFGTHVIGTGYTQGGSISSNGFDVYIVPIYDVGPVGFDVEITYTNQHGVSGIVSSVSTSVLEDTPYGTPIRMVLNEGDTGVREISNVNVIGGSIGDAFKLTSWDLWGGPISTMDPTTGMLGYSVLYSQSNQRELTHKEVYPEHNIHESAYSLWYYRYNFTLCNHPLFPDELPTIKELQGDHIHDLYYELNYRLLWGGRDNYIDYPRDFSKEIVWFPCDVRKWSMSFDQFAIEPHYGQYFYKESVVNVTYNASGFVQFEFKCNWQLDPRFTVEVVDTATGNVLWSAIGDGQEHSASLGVFHLIALEFTIRVRVNDNLKEDYFKLEDTSLDENDPIPYRYNFVNVDTFRILRRCLEGIIEQDEFTYHPQMDCLRYIALPSSDAPGTAIKAQVEVSDDGVNTSGWIGPGGSTSSRYEGWGRILPPFINGNSYMNGQRSADGVIELNGKDTLTYSYDVKHGNYWRSRIILTSDGRYSPTFRRHDFYYYSKHNANQIQHSFTDPPSPTIPIAPQNVMDLLDTSGAHTDNNPEDTYVTGSIYTVRQLYDMAMDVSTVSSNERELRLSYGRSYKYEDKISNFLHNCTLSNITQNETGDIILESETIDIDEYNDIVEDDGFLECSTQRDNTNRKLMIDLKEDTSYKAIDDDHQSYSFKYEGGFYKIVFDWATTLDPGYFILELLDEDGNVIWDKTGTDAGINEQIEVKSHSFEFRLRCISDFDSPSPLIGSWDSGITISNLSIVRYMSVGTISQSKYKYVDSMDELRYMYINSENLDGSIDVKVQIDLTDDMESYTGWMGPDGSNATYYTGSNWQELNIVNRVGKGWRERVYLSSDGTETPIFKGIDFIYILHQYLRIIDISKSWNEADLGIVMSGYAIDQYGNQIKDALQVILTSSFSFGLDATGEVDPVSGFFQIFLKDTKYDDRHLIVSPGENESYNISLRKFGDPKLIDATVDKVDPMDLTFWDESTGKRMVGKTIAHRDSLVTY